METVYRIAKWGETFERAESRKLKVLTWVAMPVGFNSSGYNAMIEEFDSDAPAIYGAWCALCGFAASCHRRGVLADGRGNPLKFRHVARVTGFPVELFERVIQWASRPDVGWIESMSVDELRSQIIAEQEKHSDSKPSGESPDDPPSSQGNPPSTRPNRTQPDITGQDMGEPNMGGHDITEQNIVRRSSGWATVGEEFRVRVLEIAREMSAMKVPGLDSADIWRIAWVGVDLDRPGLLDALQRVREGSRDGSIKKPRGYLGSTMAKMCERHGLDWDQLKPLVPPFRRSNEPAPVPAGVS